MEKEGRTKEKDKRNRRGEGEAREADCGGEVKGEGWKRAVKG